MSIGEAPDSTGKRDFSQNKALFLSTGDNVGKIGKNRQKIVFAIKGALTRLFIGLYCKMPMIAFFFFVSSILKTSKIVPHPHSDLMFPRVVEEGILLTDTIEVLHTDSEQLISGTPPLPTRLHRVIAVVIVFLH